MRYGSVCSGMEAATCAWHPLGWRSAFFSEIDKQASRFLDAKYPHVPNLGDMTKFKEWPDHAIDLLVGGTPCQSFSVAGLRKGLADPRGNLMLTYLAIADRYRPQWLVWENVSGVLSSNRGRDFGTFLGGLGQLGYGFAYRILDAQYVRVESHARAVPQRRRRVFVVGHLGDWRRAAAVLFERESLSGHPPPRREAGKGIAGGFETGPSGGGWPADVAPTFGTGWGDRHPGSQMQDMVAQKGGHFVPALSFALNAGAMGRQDAETETFVAHTLLGKSNDSHAADLDNYVAHSLNAGGFDASEDGSGRGTPIVPVAYRTAGDGAAYEEGDKSAPLVTNTDRSANIIAIQGAATRENPASGPDGIGVRDDGAQFEGPHDTANIRAADGGSSRSYVAQQRAVRRLTPVECLRLQGFPDDYFSASGKPFSDGAQYKMIGNSMAVNVMRWLGDRIETVSAIPSKRID